ncbi:MAG: M3 family metallopeptidase [Proteobacteria bacterium]|nr:M3 family metallopeptidase [Pseudomonadota bacterium]
MRTNPLLAFPELPDLSVVDAADVAPAIDQLLAATRATIERVVDPLAPPTWETLVEPLADSLDRLDRAWSAVAHLNAVVNTPALRDAYNSTLPRLIAFHTELAQDARLYARYQALRAAPAYGALDAVKQRVIENELRDFRLGGADLDAGAQAEYKAIEAELAQLSSTFNDHLLDATNAWALFVDETTLAGVPADVVAAAREEAAAAGRTGCKLTLRMPCFQPVMQYAHDRDLRARLHRAYFTRASDLGDDPALDNTPLIGKLLALRQRKAELLGYRNFAELSLVRKMADTPAAVLAFLRDLAARARPFAERDMAELAQFARETLGIATLQPWDIAYASEKLCAARYDYSEQDVKRYFPEARVLAGLFGVVESLYGVTIREREGAARPPVWHPTVRFFDITDDEGSIVGQFYLDAYARPGKQGGAWMDDPVNRRALEGGEAHPVAYLTCNFAAPVEGKPALFTHREVITLFHEFGHGLHLLLTREATPGASGLQGVEWDAVELPSQFMENFCWEWDVVHAMSRHADTGETIPRALFDKLIAARNFQSGLATVRQIEFAIADMLLHVSLDPEAPLPAGAARSPQAVVDAVRREVRVVPVAAYDRSLQAFAHIFAGGYAAGYYSYKWAEVLSADAFSLFEETGVLSADTGRRFRDEVLARGGGRPALDSFVAFRGRPPQIDALLRHNGMTLSS